MKSHYKIFLSLAFGLSLGLAGCQDDEELNLVQFPVNQPEITIDGEEGKSISTVKAFYTSDGEIVLDQPVTRNYTFNFNPSPEEATVYFEIINSQIPADIVSLNTDKVVIPAGFTTAGVTVSLQDEDFSFARDNYDEATYELGVKASVEGYKIGAEPIESKIIIEKEAYKAGCYIEGENDQYSVFNRTFAKKSILEDEPIAYKFRMKLDKPARKDVKIKISTEGIKDSYQKDITVSPAEIIIPAGQITSDIATWTINNNFLLESAKPEEFNINLHATVECEDTVVYEDQEKSTLSLKVVKAFRNIGFVDALDNNWQEIKKGNWGLDNLSSAYYLENIIDGRGGLNGSGAYTYTGKIEFIIDLKEAKEISGFALDYVKSWGSIAGAKRVMIATSMDKKEWTDQGVVYNANPLSSQYIECYEPMSAQYVKMTIFDPFDWMIYMSEVYIYENK